MSRNIHYWKNSAGEHRCRRGIEASFNRTGGGPNLVALSAPLGVVVARHFPPGLFVQLSGIVSSGPWIEDFPLLEEAFEGWPEMTGHGLCLTDMARSSRV